MKRLSRYLLLECTETTLATLLVLTFLVLLPQALRLLDFWVNKGVSAGILGGMIFLTLPRLLQSTLPMALLLGILLAVGRLSQDSEMVVMKASGISLYQIIRPIAILVVVATLFSLWLSWQWVPQSRSSLYLIRNALASSTLITVKPRTFTQPVTGLTLYVHDADRAGVKLSGILIHDQRDSKRPITLSARSGSLTQREDGRLVLFLEQGASQRQEPTGALQSMAFTSYELDLGISTAPRAEERKETVWEMPMAGLEATMAGADTAEAHRARLEWHNRLALPGATLILGLLAVPMGVQTPRSGRGYGFVVAVMILVTHILLISLGEAMAKRQSVPVWLGYWAPNAIMAGLALYIMAITGREHPLKAADWLAWIIETLPQKLLRPKGLENA